MTRFTLIPIALLLAIGFALLPAADITAQEEPKTAPTEQEWQQVVDRAVNYLKSKQNPDGSWSREQSIGITGVITTGLLKCGVAADEKPAADGLKYVESLVNPKTGHIAGMDPSIGLQNYVTSVNMMALVAADRDDRYKSVLGNSTKFLKGLQWDDSEGKGTDSDYYGGAGYDSKSRPDMSNTQFFLEALHDAGVPASDPSMKKALVFVSRCQNLKSEHNTAPWAGKINDGSFIYSSAAGGQTKSENADGAMIGYGSMTYAGIKSMIYAGVTKDDERVKTALQWIRNHYTVEANPGMPPQQDQRGLYYYYHTMGKTLDLLGEDKVIDKEGKTHYWRNDLFEALAKRQRPDGSWTNENDRWMEGDPNLVTGYALMALSYCKKK